MSAPPYMKLYVADYLGDTFHLSTVEHGAYMLLLMAMWRAGGTLPAVDAKLAQITRCTPQQWSAIRDQVMPFFTRRGGQITQKRLVEEISKYETIVGKRKEASAKGVSEKRNKNNAKTKPNGSPNGQPKANHLVTYPEPEPEPEPLKESSLRSESVVSLFGDSPEQETVGGTAAERSRFEEAWKAFPAIGRKRSSQTEAFPFWKAGVKKLKGDHQRLLEAIRRYARSENENGGGKYTKGFHLWLKACRWEPFLDDDPGDKPVRRLGKDDWQ